MVAEIVEELYEIWKDKYEFLCRWQAVGALFAKSCVKGRYEGNDRYCQQKVQKSSWRGLCVALWRARGSQVHVWGNLRKRWGLQKPNLCKLPSQRPNFRNGENKRWPHDHENILEEQISKEWINS